jgi:hypothetical protein
MLCPLIVDSENDRIRELVCGGTIPKLEKKGAFYSTQNNRKDGYKATI